MASLIQALFREQPRPFYMIFMLEIWERFGFYTVQGILTLYFIRYLGFDDQTAYYTFGAFSALVYGMVAVGGYLGDKVLGTKRTIVLGLIVLASGYLSLSLVSKTYVFMALGLICVGNGLFKANPSNLLSQCYGEQDSRLHGAFTLYYMAINLGSLIALFVGPTLSSRYGYSYAFFVSFIGILLGIANYFFQQRHIANINTSADKRRVYGWQWCIVVVGIIAATLFANILLQHPLIAKRLVLLIALVIVSIYFFFMRREERHSFKRMLVALILMLEAVIFFTLYQQMPTSLNLFAVHNVHPELFGIMIDPQSFQALNPSWIILLSPVLVWLYARLNQKGIVFLAPQKFALGMTCCGVSFLILYFSKFFHDEAGLVSSGWLIGSYLFQALGELLVSALGVAMVAELVPRQIVGFVMGMWFLTSSVAGFIGALVASFTALPTNTQPGIESLMIYTHVFACIGVITLGVAVLLWVIAPSLNRLMGNDE